MLGSPNKSNIINKVCEPCSETVRIFSDDVWFLQRRWRHNQIYLPSISFNTLLLTSFIRLLLLLVFLSFFTNVHSYYWEEMHETRDIYKWITMYPRLECTCLFVYVFFRMFNDDDGWMRRCHNFQSILFQVPSRTMEYSNQNTYTYIFTPTHLSKAWLQ